jgi:ATP-binding cassette subfamily B protein
LKSVLRQQLLGVAIGGGAALAGHAVTALLFLVGGWAVIHGNLSLGTLIAFITYFGRGAGSAGSVLALYTGYQRAKVSLGRIEELLSLPHVSECVNPRPLPDEGGRVEFNAVTVLQTDGKPILTDLTFSVTGGTKLHLAGPSGVGKTTVIDLLRRFIDADRGVILIDGIPVSEYGLEDLRRRIVVLEQNPAIIPGTVWENLIYGVQAPDQARVIQAARRAGVEEFIVRHPDGYQTVLGERGAGLSSGQAQRIAMARLLQGNPLIVVLDEATNALDRESRNALESLIDKYFWNRTRIVISHSGEVAGENLTVTLGSERTDSGL